MTTRQLIALVAILAIWLSFVARAERLRRLGAIHQRQYLELSRARLFGASGNPEAPRPDVAREAWHLKRSQDYKAEADFVESFTLALLLTAGCGVLIVPAWLRRYRRPAAGPDPPPQ